MLILLVFANLSGIRGQIDLVERRLVRVDRCLVAVRGSLTEACQTLSVALRVVLMPAVDLGE